MFRKASFLLLAVWGAFWAVPAAEKAEVQAAIDSFLLREAGKIRQARGSLDARRDRTLKSAVEKHVRLSTPLHIAAQDGDLEQARKLVSAGSDVNGEAEPELFPTPLHVATRFGRLEVMEYLLVSGANPNLGESPPLWEAAVVKRLPAMRLLLKYGADPNRGNSGGVTPLAAVSLHPWLTSNQRVLEALRLLLEAGADPKAEKPGVFQRLAEENREAWRWLRQYGARRSRAKPPDDDEPPELHRAARNGDLDLVEKIIRGGGDVNQPDGLANQTPAHYAARSGRLGALERLADHGAELAARTRRPVDDIFLSAALADNLKVLRICLAHGVPADYPTALGKTPLAAVVTGLMSSRDWDTAAFLLANGADVNGRDGNGMTPLHLMAAAPLWDFDKLGMENLLLAGAGRDLLDKDGLSPAHYAAARDNRRALALLLRP